MTYFRIASLGILLLSNILLFDNRSSIADTISPENVTAEIQVSNLNIDRETYDQGDVVQVSYQLTNATSHKQSHEKIEIQVKSLLNTSAPPLATKEIDLSISLIPGEERTVTSEILLSIPSDAIAGPYGIYVTHGRNQLENSEYQTFFRIMDKARLTCYEVSQSQWEDDFPVYLLNGGMSAEYAVQKTAESLGAGFSHTWFVSAPGSGPQPVFATPSFLRSSVQYTVDFYDRTLGEETSFDTVILSPGVSSLPYLSNAMRAPVLPLQFLVSFDTMKEVQAVLDQSKKDGYSAYTTVGHDGSVANGVAWIKLLDLPDPYTEFLRRHQVKNIILMGCTGTFGGETKSRRVVASAVRQEYQPGSIYVMYPGTSANDEATLQEKIKDLADVRLEEDFIQVADWESGIVEEQIAPICTSAQEVDSIESVVALTADDTINLYNLATYVTVAFIHKNDGVLGDVGQPIKGITLNPYLISHPIYEVRSKYVPLLYWQGVPPQATVDRLNTVAFKAIRSFFPDAELGELTVHLNSSNNCGAEFFATPLKKVLKSKGFSNIRVNDYSIDEVWNPTDGMQSPCEQIAEQVRATTSGAKLLGWSKRLTALTPEDLMELSLQFPEFKVEQRLPNARSN